MSTFVGYTCQKSTWPGCWWLFCSFLWLIHASLQSDEVRHRAAHKGNINGKHGRSTKYGFLGVKGGKEKMKTYQQRPRLKPLHIRMSFFVACASNICIHVCFMRYITFTFWTGFVGSVKESQVVISCSFVPHGPMCCWCHLLGTLFTTSNLITYYYYQ